MLKKDNDVMYLYPYYQGFHILTLLANWLKLICRKTAKTA